jgi:hypothetical protein
VGRGLLVGWGVAEPLIVIVGLAVFALALAGVNEFSSRGRPVGFYPSDNEAGEGCG